MNCQTARVPVRRQQCGCTVWRCPRCGGWQHDPDLPCHPQETRQ